MTKSDRQNKTPAKSTDRVENILAYMTAGVIGVSILTIIIVLIAYFFGYHELPALLALIPLIGMPLGMLLIITLVLVSARRRRREAK